METITRKLAILHQCHECMGHYQDGKTDCENVRCPLYSFMPYARLQPDLSCFSISPRHVGRISLEEVQSKITDKQREAGRRLAKNQKKEASND
jgi:hypothetical protein